MGPVQLNVVPVPEAVKLIVPPEHTGLLLPPEGAGSAVFTTTVDESGYDGQPLLELVIVRKYLPAAAAVALVIEGF